MSGGFLKTALLRSDLDIRFYHKIPPFFSVCSVTFSKFTELCIHHHNPISEHFHHPRKIPPSHLQSHPLPAPSALGNSILLEVSVDLSFLGLPFLM